MNLLKSGLEFKVYLIRTTMLLLLSAITLIFDHTATFARAEWKLAKNKDDVKIYARKIKGFAGKEFKGICIIDQSIEVVGAVLFDIPAYTKWFHNCLEIRKISHGDSTDLDYIFYVAIDVPWPLKNRDGIYKTNVDLDLASDKVSINAVALKKPLLPITERYVRIAHSELQWVLKVMATKRTQVTFIKRTHIGGAAGKYLSNMGSKRTIFRSLRNLHIVAEEPKYRALGRKLKETYTHK